MNYPAHSQIGYVIHTFIKCLRFPFSRLVGLALLTMVSIPLLAVERHVGEGQAFATIQSCVDASSAGDTCIVHAGTYDEAVVVASGRHNMTIQRNGTDIVTINAGGAAGSACINIAVNGAVIDGIVCTNWGSATNGGAAFLNQQGSGVVGFTVRNSTAHDGFGAGVFVSDGENVIIENNQFHDCLAPTGGKSGNGITVAGARGSSFATGTRILNNTIRDGRNDGLAIQGDWTTIAGNQILDNINENWVNTHPDGIQYIRNSGGSANIRIYDNIIRNHNQNIFLESNADHPISNVEIWGNVIYNSPGTVNGADMDTAGGNGLVIGIVCSQIQVYNNTFGRIASREFGIGGCDVGTVQVKNNIFSNEVGIALDADPSMFSSGTLDYNQYHTPDNSVIKWGAIFYDTLEAFRAAVPDQEVNGVEQAPVFIDISVGNFRLVEGTPAGLALSAPYNIDPDGLTRGGDGVWDRGAYEFDGDILRPNPPTNLRVIEVR